MSFAMFLVASLDSFENGYLRSWSLVGSYSHLLSMTGISPLEYLVFKGKLVAVMTSTVEMISA